jgi:hypothetical protein
MQLLINVKNQEEIDRLRQTVIVSAKQLKKEINECGNLDEMELLSRLKFDRIGFDPGDEQTRMNPIEQINQSWTYLASLKALEKLRELHPEITTYRLNLGSTNGFDIEDVPEQPHAGYGLRVAAEVYSAVSVTGNRKLTKDRNKLINSSARHRYVFFYVPTETAGRKQNRELNRTDLQVWALESLL